MNWFIFAPAIRTRGVEGRDEMGVAQKVVFSVLDCMSSLDEWQMKMLEKNFEIFF